MRWFSKLKRYNPYALINFKITVYHDNIFITIKKLEEILDTMPKLHSEILSASIQKVYLHNYFTDSDGRVINKPWKEFNKLLALIDKIEQEIDSVKIGDKLFSRYKRIEAYLKIIKLSITDMENN